MKKSKKIIYDSMEHKSEMVVSMTGDQSRVAVEVMKAQMWETIKRPTPEELVLELESATFCSYAPRGDHDRLAKARAAILSRLASQEDMRCALFAALPFVEEAEENEERNDDMRIRERAVHQTIKLIRAALSGKVGEA